MNPKLNKFFWCLLLMIMITASGCDQLKDALREDSDLPFIGKDEPVVEDETVLNKIENTELAKMLLKPKSVELHITKDPFEPILPEETKDAEPEESDALVNTLGDLEYAGVVRMNDTYYALMKTNSGQAVFKKGDPIRDYVVEEVDADFVLLKRGERTIRIKRGERYAK